MFSRLGTGKIGYVGQVKRALDYRTLPEDDEVYKLAREQLNHSAEMMRRSNRLVDGETLTERTAEGPLMRKGDG